MFACQRGEGDGTQGKGMGQRGTCFWVWFFTPWCILEEYPAPSLHAQRQRRSHIFGPALGFQVSPASRPSPAMPRCCHQHRLFALSCLRQGWSFAVLPGLCLQHSSVDVLGFNRGAAQPGELCFLLLLLLLARCGCRWPWRCPLCPRPCRTCRTQPIAADPSPLVRTVTAGDVLGGN